MDRLPRELRVKVPNIVQEMVTKTIFKKIRDTKGTFHTKMGSKRTEMVWN